MEKITKRLWNWASILDENTREQALRTSQMPFVRPHLALMPDAHLGAGATVGSVIPTEGAIMPAAVGVDIGCGMIAVKTQFSARDLQGRDLTVLRHSIERSVPLSAGVYNKTLSDTAKIRIAELEAMAGDRLSFYDKFKNDWRFQLGTLGSGNHFIEVTLDESDGVWLFLHSGSRGIGNKLAQHHIKIAKDLCERWYINLPDPDLAYLVEKTPEFDSYITDLNWAQHFALLNREEMMDRVVKDFAHFMGDGKPAIIDEVERINCHHNFTQQETHYGKSVWVSRKGAIRAEPGDPGLIPGSMGTASYVVAGLGNLVSLNSSPHGAGREYSRTAARKTFSLAELKEAMHGIEFRVTEAFIDEIPAAYKPIDQVMRDAADLVTVRHKLRQLINVKGD